MQRGVAIVGIVRVPEALGVVLDDAFEEGEVFEVDGSADADGDVNPPVLLRIIERVSTLGMADSHNGCEVLKCVSWGRMSVQMDMAGGKTIRSQHDYRI